MFQLLWEIRRFGCEIKEKPDKEFYDVTMKKLGQFIKTLDELERLLYHKNFLDERILDRELNEWRKFRLEIKEKYLWGKNGNYKFMESRSKTW